MTKHIEVFSKRQKFIVQVDEDDYPVLARHHWYILFVGSQDRPYAFTRFYTEHDAKNGKTFLMHHLIMGTSSSIDHINNDSLDNRKENLRIATYQENGWNKGKPKRSRWGETASQFKGVQKFVRTDGKICWRVVIKTTKKGEAPAKYVRLGPFEHEVEAAKAYNVEIVKLRGKYAWLNPIPGEAVQSS